MSLTDTKCRNAKGQIKSRKLSDSGGLRDRIERQLSHVERNEVRRAYNAAEWMPDRRRMMQWWADHIAALAREGDKIIPLSRAN